MDNLGATKLPLPHSEWKVKWWMLLMMMALMKYLKQVMLQKNSQIITVDTVQIGGS